MENIHIYLCTLICTLSNIYIYEYMKYPRPRHPPSSATLRLKSKAEKNICFFCPRDESANGDEQQQSLSHQRHHWKGCFFETPPLSRDQKALIFWPIITSTNMKKRPINHKRATIRGKDSFPGTHKFFIF